jgi:hypothetical protein
MLSNPKPIKIAFVQLHERYINNKAECSLLLQEKIMTANILSNFSLTSPLAGTIECRQ